MEKATAGWGLGLRTPPPDPERARPRWLTQDTASPQAPSRLGRARRAAGDNTLRYFCSSSVPWGPGGSPQEWGKSHRGGRPHVGGPTHAPFSPSSVCRTETLGAAQASGVFLATLRDAGVKRGCGDGHREPRPPAAPRTSLWGPGPSAQQKTSAGSIPAPGSDLGAASGARDKGWARSSERAGLGHKAASDWCQMNVTESGSCRESISWRQRYAR